MGWSKRLPSPVFNCCLLIKSTLRLLVMKFAIQIKLPWGSVLQLNCNDASGLCAHHITDLSSSQLQCSVWRSSHDRPPPTFWTHLQTEHRVCLCLTKRIQITTGISNLPLQMGLLLEFHRINFPLLLASKNLNVEINVKAALCFLYFACWKWSQLFKIELAPNHETLAGRSQKLYFCNELCHC